jgi:CTP synthase
LIEAVKHSSLYKNQQVNIKYIDSETYETDILEQLVGINGLIVPIGFGSRGVEGKIAATSQNQRCHGQRWAESN